MEAWRQRAIRSIRIGSIGGRKLKSCGTRCPWRQLATGQIFPVGLFFFGDLRDIVIQLSRFAGGGRSETDTVTFAFAVGGLLLDFGQFIPGSQHVTVTLNAAVGATKSFLKRLGTGALRNGIARRMIDGTSALLRRTSDGEMQQGKDRLEEVGHYAKDVIDDTDTPNRIDNEVKSVKEDKDVDTRIRETIKCAP